MKTRINIISFVLIVALSASMLAGCDTTVAEVDSNLGAYTVDETVVKPDESIYEVYHFTNDGIVGSTGFEGDNVDFEAVAGIKYKTSRTKVTFTAYTHNPRYLDGGDVYVQVGQKDVPVGHVANGESGTFDMAEVLKANGGDLNKATWYRLGIKLSDQKVVGHLYWDGKSVCVCRVGKNSLQNIKVWNKVVENMNPNDYLNMWVGNKSVPITYPTSGTGGCNHVQEWCDKAHELIVKDSWNDETKVYVFVQYLAENYAYDDYRVKTCDNVSRANMDNAWDDDNHFMYYNKVGNCWDYANALTIMCREYGIPCTSVDNDVHTANAVWLHGEWVCIDVSVLAQYHCTEKDTNPKKWLKHRDNYYRQAYGYYSNQFDTHNQGLCTPITATSRKANPM